MSMTMRIEVWSAAELKGVIADLSVESVLFSVPPLEDLSEAALIFYRLKQACGSRRGWEWEVEDASLAALQKASNYYDKVNLLELRLGVLRLEVIDVEDGIAVRNLRREISIKSQLQDIVTMPEEIERLLDSITVEVERIERTASVLGFTGSVAVDASDSASTASTEVEDLDQVDIVKKIEGLINLLQKIKRGEQFDVTRK